MPEPLKQFHAHGAPERGFQDLHSSELHSSDHHPSAVISPGLCSATPAERSSLIESRSGPFHSDGDDSRSGPSRFSRARDARDLSRVLELVWLERAHLPAVTALEPRCYTHAWSPQLIEGEFQKEVSFRWGLFAADVLRGYCFSYLVVDELHVLNLAVEPESQGRGYGRWLLNAVIERAVARGAAYATLEVRRSNGVAQALYHSLGFRQAGVRKSYYRDNGEDALVLERELV